MWSNKRLLEIYQFLFWIECDFRWLQTLFQLVIQIITIHRDVLVSQFRRIQLSIGLKNWPTIMGQLLEAWLTLTIG